MNGSRVERSDYPAMFKKLNNCVIAVLVLLGPDLILADCVNLDLQSILVHARISPPGTVGFREERHNPMLSEPLVLTGTLEYVEPGVLRKSVKTPFQETYLVEPQQVTVERDQQVEVLRAGQGRLIAAFLGGIEALLAGDFDRLEESFEYCSGGTPEAWNLDLTPRSRRLGKHLKQLHVEGTSDAIQSIRIDLDDEEWHVMEIQPGEIQQGEIQRSDDSTDN